MTFNVLSVAYPFAPVGPDAVGGAEQVLSFLDRALVQAGHRSIVVACEGSRTAGQLIEVPRETGRLDDDARERAWRRHRAAIADALRRWPVDLVHLHGIDFHEYLPASGVPALATLHLPPSWYPSAALRPARPETWLHCVSRTQHEACPPSPNLLAPIENGVPIEALAARHAKRGFALMLGRVCPEKGVHLAIEAAKLAGVGLLIAGEVFAYEAHQRYFAEEVAPRLDRTRRFIGPIGFARKRRLLTAARCLLVPSTAPETSSLVAREALACGTPVVAFANGALRETVDHGRTGFLVSGVDEMAQAIRAAPSISPDECRRVARERFSMERMIERYFAVYRTCRQPGEARGKACRRMSGLATGIVRAGAALEALEPAWWELWRGARASTPFQSPAWLVPWWRHFHPGELATAAAWRNGRLVGLAPFYREEGEHGRRLLPIGISISDYHDILLDPEHETEAAHALMRALDNEPSWQSLECEELPPGAAAFALPTLSSAVDLVAPQSPCPVLDLSAGSFAEVVPSRKRRHLNLARNRALRRGGAEIERVEADDLADAFAHLVRLHGLRWESQGQSGVLAEPRVCAFHREVLPRLEAMQMLRFYVLRIEGTAVAAFYGFHHADIGYTYLTGFDPGFSFESPSMILLAHAIEQAIAEGAREFHFLRGQETYKYEWGAVDRWNRLRLFRRAAAERSVA